MFAKKKRYKKGKRLFDAYLAMRRKVLTRRGRAMLDDLKKREKNAEMRVGVKVKEREKRTPEGKRGRLLRPRREVKKVANIRKKGAHVDSGKLKKRKSSIYK